MKTEGFDGAKFDATYLSEDLAALGITVSDGIDVPCDNCKGMFDQMQLQLQISREQKVVIFLVRVVLLRFFLACFSLIGFTRGEARTVEERKDTSRKCTWQMLI